ncbi:Acetylglutamate kinase [Paenibacillus sp. P1XP2]|nr:Acetylglutamate kinase [Paenibacillus sp. P1XP2]
METLEQRDARVADHAGRQSFVMKCGGSTLAALPDSFFEDLKQLQASGIQTVIVHAADRPFRKIWRSLGLRRNS